MRISDWSSDVCSSDLAIGSLDNRRPQSRPLIKADAINLERERRHHHLSARSGLTGAEKGVEGREQYLPRRCLGNLGLPPLPRSIAPDRSHHRPQQPGALSHQQRKRQHLHQRPPVPAPNPPPPPPPTLPDRQPKDF